MAKKKVNFEEAAIKVKLDSLMWEARFHEERLKVIPQEMKILEDRLKEMTDERPRDGSS